MSIESIEIEDELLGCPSIVLEDNGELVSLTIHDHHGANEKDTTIQLTYDMELQLIGWLNRRDLRKDDEE